MGFKARKLIIALFMISCACSCNGQDTIWKQDELIYYSKVKGLCTYLQASPSNFYNRQEIFENYILYANPKNDTTQNRRNYSDMILSKLYRFVDSVGLENLDAKPLRFFEHDTTFYKPFVEDMQWSKDLVLVYYDKRRPEKPLGSLLFDPTSHKLVSWIVLNMGGYLFVTPNMY